MTRIVTTHYRYKRPPRRKKPVALEVPAVIKGKSSRRPADSQVAAEVISLVPRMRDGATKSTTAVDAPRDQPVTGCGKPTSSIVTARRPKAVANLPPGLLPEIPEEHRSGRSWRRLTQRVPLAH
jgi:hypothetical protein